MKIGISSWTYSWNIIEQNMSAMELLRKTIELGANVLQIADNLPLEKLSEDELNELRIEADKAGIVIETGTAGVRPGKLIPFLYLSRQMGATLVRTLLHDAEGCPSLEEAENHIREIVPVLKELGLTLAIENHDFFSVRELRKLIERIDEDCVKICLDPVNNLAQGESTKEVFDALGEYTVNFHCKDYVIQRKPSKLGFDVVGCPSGEGMLNLPKCKEYFSDREISFVVELWTPEQETMEDTCELEAQWAEQSIVALKSLR